MKKFLWLFFLSMVGINYLSGQTDKTFVFQNTLNRVNEVSIDNNMVSRHFLGENIARKMYLVQNAYTYIEKGSPTSPGDKIVVRNPVIYNAVKKINNHYKSLAKKGTIPAEELEKNLGQILDVAYCISSQETDEFEDYIKQHKKADQLEKIFLSVVLR
jgi:hypothetical protein